MYKRQVKDTKPKKDKDGIEAVDYDEVKTEIKEVDSDFSRACLLYTSRCV